MAQARKKARRERPVARGVFWRELALLIVCVEIAIFILSFDPSILNVFDLTKASFTHGLAWALLGAIVVIAFSDGVRVPASPLFLAFFAVIATEVIATATAENQYVALYGEVGRYLGLTTHAVLALIAVAIAVSIDYPRRTSWLAWTIGAGATLAGVYAIQQATGHDPVQWVDLDSRFRPFATFGNPDFYGQFLAVVATACVAILVFTHQRLWLIVVVILLAVLNVALMLIVQTRGSLLGIAAGALVIAVLWLRRAGLSRRALTRFALASAVAALALVITLVATPLGGRLLDIGRGIGLRDRVLLYQSAFQMFVDHPFLGVGFENFAVAYPRYQQAEWFGIAGMNTTNTSAHNWVLHVAATTGALGLLANVALLGAFAFHAWRRARDADAAGVIVALAAIAAFYGSGLVLPGAQSIQWIPWVCVGVALASDLRSSRVVASIPPLRPPAFVGLLIVVAFASVAFGQLGSLDANRAAKAAEAALAGSNAARAVGFARTATAIDPGRAMYWNDLGRALELVPDLGGARTAYRQATTRSPYTPAFWWNLGRMELEFAKQNEPGAHDSAYEAMRRSIAADPQNPDSFDRFARIQFALGDYKGAIENERQAIAFFPTVAGYYTVGSEAAHQLGDTDGAIDFLRRGIAATDSNELRVALARRLIEATRFPEARQVLREALAKEPANAAALELQKQIGAR
ncbi:MAG TPA: O-antigen ligase family protein [Candidatus Limnocylindria bacterium]|nr:O-antigen ligase family protein [Candidatus Limnocylindria bacterium]